MITKRIHLNEFNTAHDKEQHKVFHSNPHTEIILRNPDTGEILFKGSNRVIGAGGDMVARKIFDVEDATQVIPTYNTELGIPDPGEEDPGATYDTRATALSPKVLAFMCGTDGCGTEGSQIYAVDYNSRIAPEAVIPFRYPLASNDLSDEERELYLGRKEDGDYIAYYFKRFSSEPELFEQYLDGTAIESDVYQTEQEYEVFVETKLMITKEDLREYFIATVGIEEARVNTVSLLYGYFRQVDGKLFLLDCRPMTKLNFSNEYMIDVTKSIEIIYHTYF